MQSWFLVSFFGSVCAEFQTKIFLSVHHNITLHCHTYIIVEASQDVKIFFLSSMGIFARMRLSFLAACHQMKEKRISILYILSNNAVSNPRKVWSKMLT